MRLWIRLADANPVLHIPSRFAGLRGLEAEVDPFRTPRPAVMSDFWGAHVRLGFDVTNLGPQTVILHKPDGHPLPYARRGSLQAGERDVVLRVQQTVHLGSARDRQRGHLVLGELPFLHGLGKLATMMNSPKAP